MKAKLKDIIKSPAIAKPCSLCASPKPVPTSNATFRPFKKFKIAHETELQTHHISTADHH